MQPSFKFRLTNMNNVWGNLATWIRGYMDSWLHGFVATWIIDAIGQMDYQRYR